MLTVSAYRPWEVTKESWNPLTAIGLKAVAPRACKSWRETLSTSAESSDPSSPWNITPCTQTCKGEPLQQSHGLLPLLQGRV